MATISGSKRLLNISGDAMAATNNMTYGGLNVATEQYVSTQVSNIVSSAPGALDTLNELAAALGDDPNFATTITTALAGKLATTHDMTLTLSGDASGSATFTNMSNATLTVVVANDSHTHDGRYYTETEVNNLLAGKASSSHNHNSTYLGLTAKAADANLLDGINSDRFVYGKNARGKSIDLRNGNANTSDATNASGFYYGHTVTGMPDTDWWNWITVAGADWSGGDGYMFQLAGSFWSDDFRIRRMTSGTVHDWKNLIHSGNIGSYAVTSESYTQHENTSNLSGFYGGNNNGVVIEDIEVDANGHVTAVGTRDLDGRFAAASHNHDGRYLRTHTRLSGNADSINASGIHIWDVSTAEDDPAGAADGLLTTKYWDSTNWAVQSYHDFHSNKLYIRSKQSNTWQPEWAEVWTTANFNPASYQPAGSYLTSIPSEYLTQTEGDARYLQSLPSHNHDDRYYTESESDSRFASRGFVNNAYVEFTVGGEPDVFYPVRIGGGGAYAFQMYSVSRRYNWAGPDTWYTASHRGGLTLTIQWSGDTAWGGNDKSLRVIQFDETYSTVAGGMALPVSGGLLVWLRGGGAVYHCHSPRGVEAAVTVELDGYVAANGVEYLPRTLAEAQSGQSSITSNWPVRDYNQLYDTGNRVATQSWVAAQNYLTTVPNIAASKITSGTLADARIASAANWNSAYNNYITGISITGTTTKTITLTQRDGGTISDTFTDLSGAGGDGNDFLVAGGFDPGTELLSLEVANQGIIEIELPGVMTDTDTNTWRGIHDTPVNGATTTSISSNWAFDNVKTAVPANAVFTDTQYSVGDGGLTEKNFTSTLKTKLDGIAANATNVTNNNQLTNGAGYLTASNDRVYITDTRGAQRAPSYYNDRYAQWDFQNSADTTAGGDSWHSLLTVSKWASFHPSHRQEQLIFTGDNLKRRTAASDSEWGEVKTIWDTGNLDPVVDASVSNDTITFTRAGGDKFDVTTSDANTNTWRPLGTGANDAAAGNHTHDIFNGGAPGFVPEATMPDDIDQNYFLNGAGDWAIPPDNNTWRSIDQTPTNGATGDSISSDWAYDNVRLFSNGGENIAGSFTATGDITAFSDARVKENVETIPNALDSVKELRGVSYNKIGSEEKSIGVIAQEIQEVLPEVVKEGQDGMLSVAYGNITAVLIEAIKEQQEIIAQLEERIVDLENRM